MSEVISQNETTDATPTVDALTPDAMAKVTIRELVPKTFDDGSRISDVTRTATLFEDYANAVESWRDTYRDGKRISRKVAVAQALLRRACTDINGDPLWAVKGLTAWKVIYSDRIAATFESLGMSDDETSALETATKGYLAQRNMVVAAMAQYAIDTTPLLADEDWSVNGETWKVGKAVSILLGDDQAAASMFEGVRMPPKLMAAIEVERKRQKVTKGAKKGQFKQGFEKKWTYFGPKLESRAPATPNDEIDQPERAVETVKGHSDAVRIAVTDGNIGMLATINFIREQLAACNAVLVKSKPPKGGNIPAIVEALEALAKEATLLADFKRPGDGAKPDKEAVVKASIEIGA